MTTPAGGNVSDPKLIPVFIPSLVALLLNFERKKGSPLTEKEVLEIRDNGVCMMMTEEHAIALDKRREYNDLDPENVWEQWLEAHKDLV